MPKVTVVATYDSSLVFYNPGQTYSIDSNSVVVGIVNLPTTPPIKGTVGYVPQTAFLNILTKPWGNLYLNMSLDAYNSAVAAATASAGAPGLQVTYTVGVDVAAGSSITTPFLYNKVITAIFVDGLTQDIRNFAYTSGVGVGTLNFSSIGGVSAPSIVQIQGYTP